MHKMKIIFLDIDGVMNSSFGKEPYESDMEVSKLLLLKRLIDETRSNGIVITSDRRYSNIDMKHKTEVFNKYGINVLGKIRYPNIKDPLDNRGKQIMDYLSNSKEEISNIVIIDDIDDGISNLFPNEFILVNKTFGLNENNLNKAIEMLNS